MEKGKLEAGLMKHLGSPGMDKNTLRYYSDFIVRVQKKKFKLERIWWDGQPWPDIMVAQTRIPIKEIGSLVRLFDERIHGLEIFPLGIPFPEELMVNIRTQR